MGNAQIDNTLFVKVHPYMPEKICIYNIHLYASKLSVLESLPEEQQEPGDGWGRVWTDGQVALIDPLSLVVSLGLTTFSCNMIQYGHNQYLGIPKLALLT